MKHNFNLEIKTNINRESNNSDGEVCNYLQESSLLSVVSSLSHRRAFGTAAIL